MRSLFLDVAPLRGHVSDAVALVSLVERVEPDAVAFRAACSCSLDVGLHPHGRVPEIGELGPLEEDTVDDDHDVGRAGDAEHVGTEALEIERVAVEPLRRKVAALVALRLSPLELIERDADGWAPA